MILAASLFGGPSATPWMQVTDVVAAVVCCGIIGLEREVRRKAAGLRTHATVGLAAAVIMIVSKYGFGDVIGAGVVLDPSRVAAQIVSGIGFMGAGLIFVRRDAVRGLTTAASVWLTAAVGMACGAHLIPLAVIATLGYLLFSTVLLEVERRLPQRQVAVVHVEVSYHPRRGALRQLLHRCTARDFVIVSLSTETPTQIEDDSKARRAGPLLSETEQSAAPSDADINLELELDDEVDAATGQVDDLVHLSIGLRGPGSVSTLLSDVLSVAGVVSVASEGTGEAD